MPLQPASSQKDPVTATKKREAIYSFDWAVEKVRSARQCHPRAWEMIMRWSALTERQLAYLLACNDPSWPALRELTHQWDKWEAQQAKVNPKALLDTTQTYSSLLRLHKNSLPDDLRRHLTARLKQIKLSEQVEEVGVGTDTPLLFTEAELDNCGKIEGGVSDITLHLE